MTVYSCTDVDYTDELARLPRRPNARALPPRPRATSTTLHYSGVVYADRSRAAELQRIKAEAVFHLNKNWAKPGQPAAYQAAGLMYDMVVLSDGLIVQARRTFVQLWHTGNATGNRESASVHVMLGPGQAMTDAQRASLSRVFDEIGLPVVGHCEWPVGDGPAVPQPVYHRERGQSECPGAVVFADLARYRAGSSIEAPGGGRHACDADFAAAWDLWQHGYATGPQRTTADGAIVVPCERAWLKREAAGRVRPALLADVWEWSRF